MMADGCSSCDLCSAQVPADSPTVWVVTHQHPATDVDSKYVRTRDAEMDPKLIN